MKTFRNWRFHPRTGAFNPKPITAETQVIQYWEETNAYGFICREVPQFRNPSTFKVFYGLIEWNEVSRSTPPSSGQFNVDYYGEGYYARSVACKQTR